MSDCCCQKKISKRTVDFDQLDQYICYCFKKTKGELLEAIEQGKADRFVEEIKGQIKLHGCSCDKLNPSGQCCLPDIDVLIKARS